MNRDGVGMKKLLSAAAAILLCAVIWQTKAYAEIATDLPPIGPGYAHRWKPGEFAILTAQPNTLSIMKVFVDAKELPQGNWSVRQKTLECTDHYLIVVLSDDTWQSLGIGDHRIRIEGTSYYAEYDVEIVLPGMDSFTYDGRKLDVDQLLEGAVDTGSAVEIDMKKALGIGAALLRSGSPDEDYEYTTTIHEDTSGEYYIIFSVPCGPVLGDTACVIISRKDGRVISTALWD